MIGSFYKGKVNETDEITKDNFRIFAGKREFENALFNYISIRITKWNQDLYTLKSRNIAIEALNEGINFVRQGESNDSAMFPPMLQTVPSVILSSVLFSCPKIDIEAIISVLRMADYINDINQATEMIRTLHGQQPDKTYKLFVDILPIVLRRLAASDESFPGKHLIKM